MKSVDPDQGGFDYNLNCLSFAKYFLDKLLGNSMGLLNF